MKRILAIGLAVGMSLSIGMNKGFCDTKKDNKVKVAYNYTQDRYEFFPSVLGGYSYKFTKLKDMNNCVAMYQEIKENTKNNKHIKMKVTKVWMQKDGDKVTEYSNGAWYITNDKTKEYVLQPAELGDWDLEFHNKAEFNKYLESYLKIEKTQAVSLENRSI